MDEIMEIWEELKFEVANIGTEMIPEDQREVLIGMGNRKAKILFIGNDPDLYFSEEYKVDINSSGEFFIKLLDILEISPEDYYVTTLAKRKLKFKGFSDENKKKLIDLLYMQIALISPKIIVFLGKETAEAVLSKNIDFEKERGNFENWLGEIKVLTTYDVETVRRARKDEGKKSLVATNFWNDLKNLKSRLENE